MQSAAYDAIVVGSGISGGWAAKELTEKGLRVLLLERGKNIEHIKDYVNATKGPWEYPHRGGRTQEMERRYPVLKRDFPLNEKNLDWWASDEESPYTEVKRFDWYRGYHVGGRSLMWGRCSFRWSDFDFEANAQGRAGHRLADPLRRHRAVVQPRRALRGHRRIEGGTAAAARRRIPAGDAAQLRRAARRGTPNDAIRRQAAAHLQPNREPHAAARRARRVPVPRRLLAGLPVRRLLQHAVLDAAGGDEDRAPDAQAVRHRLPRSCTTRIAKRATRRARARCRDEPDRPTTRRKVVFLCASTLNSTWLLLRSATDVWPGGLGSSSGELGHNLMDHHFRVGAQGRVDGLEDKYFYGRRPNPSYIPRYRNLFGDKRPYLRGFGYEGGAGRDGWSRAVAELGVGGAFKDTAAEPGQWTMGGTAFGEMLPNHENKVTLDETKKDKWGLPVLKIDCATGENERLMRKDMANDMAEMLRAVRREGREHVRRRVLPGHGHPRDGHGADGAEPEELGAQHANQVWDAPNVFVTDGSCMASTACQNPSLTYMALTARAADYAVDELNRRNL